MIDLALAAHSHSEYASSSHTHDSSEITNLPSGFTSFSDLYALDLTNINLVVFSYTVRVPKNDTTYGNLAYAIDADNVYTYARHLYSNTAIHQVDVGTNTTNSKDGVRLSWYYASGSSNRDRTLSGVGFIITFGPTYGALCATTYSNPSNGTYYLSTYSIKPYTSETTYLRIMKRSGVTNNATDTTYGSFSGMYI